MDSMTYWNDGVLEADRDLGEGRLRLAIDDNPPTADQVESGVPGEAHRPSVVPSAAAALWRALPVVALPMMRWSLALMFVWFGVLKVLGLSPVSTLVESTVPGGSAALVVAALGIVEIVLGVGLFGRRTRRLVPLLVVLHLCGTFLSFVAAPELTIRDGNPLLLTTEGEFVMKNLVLISGALILAAYQSGAGRSALQPHAVTRDAG